MSEITSSDSSAANEYMDLEQVYNAAGVPAKCRCELMKTLASAVQRQVKQANECAADAEAEFRPDRERQSRRFRNFYGNAGYHADRAGQLIENMAALARRCGNVSLRDADLFCISSKDYSDSCNAIAATEPDAREELRLTLIHGKLE